MTQREEKSRKVVQAARPGRREFLGTGVRVGVKAGLLAGTCAGAMATIGHLNPARAQSKTMVKLG